MFMMPMPPTTRGHRGDRGEQHVEDLPGLGAGLDDFRHVADGERIVGARPDPVPLPEHFGHLALDVVHHPALGDGHENDAHGVGTRSGAAEHAAARGFERDHDDVVLVGSHRTLALLEQRPHDDERHVLDAHGLSERVRGAEELRRDARSEQGDLAAAAYLLGLEVPALVDLPAPRHEVLVVDALDGRGPVGVADDHLGHPPHGGRGGDDLRDLGLERPGVGDRQPRLAAARRADAAPAARPGHHHEQVAAERTDLAVDLGLGAGADGDHGDHRGHSDDDAEHRQDAPHQVDAQGLQGNAEEFGEGHRQVVVGQRLALIGDDLAIPETQHPARVARHFRFVRHDQDGDAGLVEFLEQLHDLHARGGVEGAGGLIGQQHDRRVYERAGDGDPLLLSAGELCGDVSHAVTEPHPFERRLGPRAPLPARHARVQERQLDVVEGTGAAEQVELLEDEADLPVANLREGVPGQFGNRLPVDDDAPAGGGVEAADHVHEGRLAGTGRPHHGQELPAFDAHRHVVQGADRFVADDVILVEVFAGEHAARQLR